MTVRPVQYQNILLVDHIYLNENPWLFLVAIEITRNDRYKRNHIDDVGINSNKSIYKKVIKRVKFVQIIFRYETIMLHYMMCTCIRVNRMRLNTQMFMKKHDMSNFYILRIKHTTIWFLCHSTNFGPPLWPTCITLRHITCVLVWNYISKKISH